MANSRLLSARLRRLERIVLPFTASLVLAVLAVVPAKAQTYSVIHAFTGGVDGAGPLSGLTIDNAGILYGTTAGGGTAGGRRCSLNQGCGVAFEMKHRGGGWVLTPLYGFTGLHDGGSPRSPLVFGPSGTLFGSTLSGGNYGVPECEYSGCGVIYTLHPPATVCHSALCNWIENPIYQFLSFTDAWFVMGNLTFDRAGNLYGTSEFGGDLTCTSVGCGTVFQLTRSGSTWTKTTLHAFMGRPGGGDGELPFSGVIVDSLGNLYGTTDSGGANDYGTVFELTPSGTGWTYSVIYNFRNLEDGNQPMGGLVMDAEGNLYGAASGGGVGGGGTVYELSPSGSGWTFSVLASMSGSNLGGSLGSLAFDSAGSLYGTTNVDGSFDCGSVFKLTPSGGQWIYTDLYDFTCGNDGGRPQSGVTLDASGNIYGAAPYAGPTCSLSQQGCGVIWEITP